MLKKLVVTMVLLATVCGLMAQGVSRQYKDVDGDGLPEVILENEYLQVIVMTGEMPKEIPEPVELPDGRKVPYKYGERFARGGWIYNMIFKPTNRKWFINDITQGEHRHGIPEEFEITERMREVEPGFYEAMKPSVGTGIGPGLCFRNTLKDMKIPAWGMKEEMFVDGEWKAADKATTAPAKGWRLTFTHVISTDLGYGCAYTKVLTLMDGESVLRTHRELANTGEKAFSTSFYTHGFFSQGQTNGVLDHNCWSVIPLCPPSVKDSPFPKDLIDVERGIIHATRPAYYWGAKSYDEVGGNFHACGNDATKDVFLTSVDRKPEFFRMWNCDMTYSYEPFMVFNIKGGKKVVWNTNRGVGNGLTSVKAYGDGGMLDWDVALNEKGTKVLNIRFLPFKTIKTGLSFQGTITVGNTTQTIDSTMTGGEVSPLQPWVFPVDLSPEIANAEMAEMHLYVSEEGQSAGNLANADGRYRLSMKPRTAWDGDGKGAKGVILSDTSKDDDGAWKHHMSTQFAQDYLAGAGIEMSLSSAMEDGGELDWANLKLVILASRRINIKLLRKLEDFAKQGGTVIVTGMIDFRQFELSDLLPIKFIYGESNTYALNPRDGTLEFMTQDNYRYQLKAVGDHEITRGLPWYPESYQSVGALQRVVPKDDAQVILNFVPGPGMSDAGNEFPALVLGKYGQGKVAYFGSPIAWGGHQSNCMWGRLGEYHQKFFVQLALWGLKK